MAISHDQATRLSCFSSAQGFFTAINQYKWSYFDMLPIRATIIVHLEHMLVQRQLFLAINHTQSKMFIITCTCVKSHQWNSVIKLHIIQALDLLIILLVFYFLISKLTVNIRGLFCIRPFPATKNQKNQVSLNLLLYVICYHRNYSKQTILLCDCSSPQVASF